MARLRSRPTLSTVAHRSPMLSAGSVSGQPHSNWRRCHDIGYPLLDAEHSQCTAPWFGTPCRTTSAHSRTMSPLDRAWKPGFSSDTSVFSALETFVIIHAEIYRGRLRWYLWLRRWRWYSGYWVGLCLLVYFYLYFVYYCLYLCSLPVYILVNKAVYIKLYQLFCARVFPIRPFLSKIRLYF